MSTVAIKRGAALRLQLTFQNDDGTPVDLTNVGLYAKVRTAADDLVTTLPIVRASVVGVALVTVLDTTTWPIGLLRSDILAVVDGVPVVSDTFGISVQRSITP